MLKFFLELKYSYETDLGQDHGTFLSHGEFTHKYDFKCNFLQYLQVVSAIPQRLVNKAKRNMDAKFTFSLENSFFSSYHLQ